VQERVVSSGKIVFPKGTEKDEVAKKCRDCFFYIPCQGPEGGDGRVFAFVADDVSKPSDEEIEQKAVCLKN
jgi:hypothetical protein